jgi:4'-phosphopantetheinyl transferase EntD
MPISSQETTIQSLFAPEVVAEEMTSPALLEDLHPAERACVDGAQFRRKLDFATGRVCARRALARLGATGLPLLMGDKGVPVWPPGIVGSISHCDGCCGAAVARRQQIQGIGLDIERIQEVDEGFIRLVCTPPELDWIRSVPPARQPAAAILLFSAKECFYKCQYPLTQRWLGFHDVRITAHVDDRAFEAALIAPAEPAPIAYSRGRYIIRDRYVLTGVTACKVE